MSTELARFAECHPKGYMERVFSKQFAYRDTEKGLEGLLKDKGIFVIMNAGWVGMGRGSVGDGIPQKAGEKSNPIWDSYMTAYKTVWDDTAGFWGVKNLGQFVNDRAPGNLDADYAEKLQKLRNELKASLDRNFGLKCRHARRRRALSFDRRRTFFSARPRSASFFSHNGSSEPFFVRPPSVSTPA